VWEEIHLEEISKSAKQGHMRKKVVWLAPPQVWVKINTDGGYCPRTNSASIGVVARGRAGNVLLTEWRFLRHCRSPEEAEVEACLDDICLTIEWI
jgi:hypothetical protein